MVAQLLILQIYVSYIRVSYESNIHIKYIKYTAYFALENHSSFTQNTVKVEKS